MSSRFNAEDIPIMTSEHCPKGNGFLVPPGIAKAMASMDVKAGDMVTTAEDPQWSMMATEARRWESHVEDVLARKSLGEQELEELFHELPKKIKATCVAEKLEGSIDACHEAVKILYRWHEGEITELGFIESQFIDTLKKVLKEAAKITVSAFNGIKMPRFSIEATNELNQSPDLREILMNDVRDNLKADLAKSSMWKMVTT